MLHYHDTLLPNSSHSKVNLDSRMHKLNIRRVSQNHDKDWSDSYSKENSVITYDKENLNTKNHTNIYHG